MQSPYSDGCTCCPTLLLLLLLEGHPQHADRHCIAIAFEAAFEFAKGTWNFMVSIEWMTMLREREWVVSGLLVLTGKALTGMSGSTYFVDRVWRTSNISTIFIHLVETMIQCLSDITTITLWQNRPKWGTVTVPKFHFITLELSPYDKYRPVTNFCPCPELVTISDNYCITGSYATILSCAHNAWLAEETKIRWEQGMFLLMCALGSSRWGMWISVVFVCACVRCLRTTWNVLTGDWILIIWK